MSQHISVIYNVLKAATAVFDNIYVVKGNHDARVLKALQKTWGMDHIWKVFTVMGNESIYDRFRVTENYWRKILDAPRGESGFGYDPVFFLPETGKTFAEMTLAEKQVLSHRGRAMRKARAMLSAWLEQAGGSTESTSRTKP